MSIVYPSGERCQPHRLPPETATSLLGTIDPTAELEHWQLIAFATLVLCAEWQAADALKPFVATQFAQQSGSQATLLTTDRQDFWTSIRPWLDAPRSDMRQFRWKAFAMLSLRESGWTMEEIGSAWQHDRGHVSRCISSIRRQLRQAFRIQHEIVIPADAQN